MLNTLEINGTTLFVGADESGSGLVACDVAFRMFAAGAVLVQLTDIKSNNVGNRLATWLETYELPKTVSMDRFIVVDNFRLHITAVSLAEKIREAVKKFEGVPIVILLDLAPAMLPTFPENHSLGVLHELPLHLPETSVVASVCYGYPGAPPPRLADYPADTIWQVQNFRTVMFSLKEVKPGERVLRFKSKQAWGGLIVFQPTETFNE